MTQRNKRTWKITVIGIAKSTYKFKRELHGIDCQDDFCEDFDNDFTFRNDVTKGYMDFRFEKEKLYTYTTYESRRRLTQKELNMLKEYTTGQWSYGIGEGFEQEPAFIDSNGKEHFISPWHVDQKAVIKQIEVI